MCIFEQYTNSLQANSLSKGEVYAGTQAISASFVFDSLTVIEARETLEKHMDEWFFNP
jgi:hypothetical protein